MEWISVDDQLPDRHDILMTYNNLVLEGSYANGKFYEATNCCHIQPYCRCYEQEGITHWMPLPEPPKQEE